jgi:3-dehydroquinate synthase
VSRTTRSVRVSLPGKDRSYPIRVGAGTLGQAGEAIADATKATRAVVVSVPPVARRYAPRLERSLRDAGLRTHRVVVPDGDRSKSLRQTATLYDAFLEAGADRSTAVVALGGGVVGDLAGFAAATFLRGVPFVQVPTTVLAMVDSSVGGKVGVNVAQGKNLVGAFHQPRLVWVDVDVLGTLPARQRAAGMVEAVKHGAILDRGLFERFERGDLERALDLDPAVLVPLLTRAVAVKARVVEQDEREAGIRTLLNFGHTLAHAAEKLSGYRKLLHGEAVGAGMVFAARRSEALDFAPAGTAERIQAVVERLGIDPELPSFPRRAYLSALRVDKKRTEAHIRFVVLRRIGAADTVPLTPSEVYPPRPGPSQRRKRRRSQRR